MYKIEKFDSIIKKYEMDRNNKIFLGIKDTNVIPLDYFKDYEKYNMYIHTIDKASRGGRAIDIDLINPITGRLMTGSSSGTAINVFHGINDIGIGTDGGGSVLAPACALNLYGFISKLICKNHVIKFTRKSTDNIKFYPSIGYISRDFKLIENIVAKSIGYREIKDNLTVLISLPKVFYHKNCYLKVSNILKHKSIDLSYDGLNRRKMMSEIQDIDFNNNILITFEGPIDLFGYGDSIIGHYGSFARDIQKNGHKYYIKVINMLGLTSIIIPSGELSSGILITGKSHKQILGKIFDIANKLLVKRSELEESYFSIEEEEWS